MHQTLTTGMHWFLAGCSNRKSANLSGLERLESVGTHFMAWCTSLESFDATHLKALKRKGHGFLDGCSNLKAAPKNVKAGKKAGAEK